MSNPPPPDYDLVIVGGGISGAVVAKTVIDAANKNKKKFPKILILEAGRATALSADKYDTYVEAYHEALIKVPNAPYPASSSAPQPDVLDIRPVQDAQGNTVTSDHGYFVQKGPLPFGSDYARSLGGTTLHWLGTCLRMLPNDFKMRTVYKRAVDWPLTYDQLKPYYERAEWDIIGVAANVDSQHYPGIDGKPKEYFKSKNPKFDKGLYRFPMEEIPSSYLDRYIEKTIGKLTIELPSSAQPTYKFPVRISNTPVARNSTPTDPDYRIVGAAGNAERGQRCEGNSSCIPICPVQAKYNALKTLYELIVKYPWDLKEKEKDGTRARVAIRSQSVAMQVTHAKGTDAGEKVTGITYKRYYDDGRLPTEHTVTARTYVLAANAIENATLLLASKAANRSRQVGRNLMDHPLLLTWGLLKESAGAYRGPGSTSGIPAFRDGAFRDERTAFRVEIGNWGWNFPENAPYDTVLDLVGGGEKPKLYGKDLRRRIGEIVPRQFRIAWELEQDPEERNRVTIDDAYRDALGKHRPVIHYDLSEYVRASLPWAAEANRQLFTALGIANKVKRPEYKPGDYSHYDTGNPMTVEYGGVTYWVAGAGHVVGTHRMGKDPKTSVVDDYQRSHDLPNLYIVGCGSMPTLGTSNPTLTMTALALRTADKIAEELFA
ncbi:MULTISPECIES: GMC family oxidoreductase [unclassified Streptomyces]|uniref:GMC family oxidoreductase n=1 Tax=unclassified Streptomyces TaxID=2593676 RepID=UPI000DD4FF3C|nr:MULTISPECIES: GMC family oxidoreductase [unclassified Streptomyces]QZZ26240.1 GMC family oxidoreductase [Streptomyces sp. ST1015]